MFSPIKITQYFTIILILPAIFLSTCSETSEFGDASDYEKLGAADSIVPTITSVSPIDNSSDVSVSTTISVTFSEKILTSTATTNTSDTACSGSFQLSSDNFSSCVKMSVAPSVSNDDKTFTLTPAASLSGRATYLLKLTTSVKDTGGNALETYITNGFRTYYNRFTSGSGTISGTIIKQVDGSALSGVDIMYNESGYTTTVNSDSNGVYGIYALTAGSYTLTYSNSGYFGATQSATLAKDTDNITIATLSMLSNTCSGGNISGTIKDAVTGSAVSGASIGIRSGKDNRSNSIISGKTATTANNGTYTISSVDAGYWTVEVSKSGMINSYINVESCNGKSNQDKNMSETLPDGAMRIVLEWRGTEDFDAHLEIPVSDSTNGASNSSDGSHLWWTTNQTNPATPRAGVTTRDYHIYGTGDNVTLDQDNTDGIVASCSSGACGPETISISKLRSSGSYRYHVHAFTRKGSNTSHIADNGTVVSIFYDDTSWDVYPPKQPGDLWTIFDFTVSDNFTWLNIMDSQGTPGNVDNH